jgi:hypothetical protein
MNVALVAVAFLSLSAVQANDNAGAPASPASPELSGTGGQGQQSSQVDPQTGERLQCRRVSESGTHRYRRVCMTAAQWRNYEDNQ